ncbi:sugar phosphate isomerase/epimerase family protein [Arachidicoccus terrestris]|uniref:sugar phosphate isomerase/epimerase family protein n=1 Tax=Arachidicoccus terrestris TaxID=2875539 RepID=UPI001CC34C61|nr:TIM barrel protein [Arachidicoccus terrestris]UAY56638.1 sugar phosphate isomerase/epimerase [Arachidicoccus terrestris]
MKDKRILVDLNNSRRDFIRNSAVLLAGMAFTRKAGHWDTGFSKSEMKVSRYRIGVADLMIYKRQKIGAFELTKRIGAEGVEVDMGGLGDRPTFNSKLADPAVCKAFLDEAEKYGLEICSVAMTGFYAQSFAERPTWQRMIGDCLDTAKRLKVKTTFLPLGITCDLRKYPKLRPAIVTRLKVAGQMAVATGTVIGIETSLDAAGERRLLEEIGSPGIKSYFNFANPVDHQLDICNELKILGKDNICQIHGTNSDGVHLSQDPEVNMPKIKQTLDQMGWSGWLVLQRSRDQKDPKNVLYNFGANSKYMESIFK